MPPDRVGSYLIEKKIGAGGMGTVYLAHHADSGNEVAVKVLPASLAREEGFIIRFEREIEALGKLSHPNIVAFLEAGEDDGLHYYAMEYVDGETLTNRIRRESRIPWRDVIDISLQICLALKAAHDSGVIHRDLKPSNILVQEDGTVKLSDFGVAHVFAMSRLTVTGGIIGTVEYMSPEQAQGKRVSPRSDLYSLGALMYVMLTGRPPFTGESTVEVMQKHKFSRFDPPQLIATDMPHWLDEIVCQLLEKEPEKRFADAYVLSRRLREVLGKVNLSTSAGVTDENSPLERPTALAGGDEERPTALAGGDEGPIGGTLMRDLVRNEIRRSQEPTKLGQILDNTWVLVGLLLLIVGGGWVWFQSRHLSPQDHFDLGVALMQNDESVDWLTARDEHFQPLLDADSKRWSKKIAPHMERIQIYELKTSLAPRKRLRKKKKTASEPERFLKLALHYREVGDMAQAESTLMALETLLSGRPDDKPLLELTEQLLDDLRKEVGTPTVRYGFLEESLKRARKLSVDGTPHDARQLLKSIIQLYEADPHTTTQMKEARELLKKVDARPDQ
jgi:serine/threonine protein kinase